MDTFGKSVLTGVLLISAAFTVDLVSTRPYNPDWASVQRRPYTDAEKICEGRTKSANYKGVITGELIMARVVCADGRVFNLDRE